MRSLRSTTALAQALALALALPALRAQDKPQDSGNAAPSKTAAETDEAAKPAAQESVEQLLARIAKTIRDPEAPERLNSFRAKVSANVRAQGKAHKIDVTIDYLAPVYLRTEVKEGGKTILRGRNRGLLPWMKQGEGEAYSLGGKDYESDRRAVARDLAIASGMTRFLYPDRVLAGLADRIETPLSDDLPWRRNERIPAFRVEGIAKDGSDFPLASSPEHEGPVRVRAWFDKKSLALLAIMLEPLADMKTKRPVGLLEELRFLEHTKKDGLMLPKKILLRIEDREAKRMRTTQSVELIQFRANPLILTKDYFKKPK